jgi:hypothetical protein
MRLSEYPGKTIGRGIMTTADATGHLTAAIYAKPHFFQNDSIAFIMTDRLTHQSLQSNPHAVYLFMESREGYPGSRTGRTSCIPLWKSTVVASDNFKFYNLPTALLLF